jgi:hypothetical protein
MTVAKKTSKTTTTAKTTKSKLHRHVEDQPLELLAPKEFEAITAANYEHPESRIILRLFLQVNYIWHVSRHMQGLPSAVNTVDWKRVEENSAQSIRNTFQKLLPGVQTTAWDGRIPEKYKKV